MYWEVVGNHMWRVYKASQIPPLPPTPPVGVKLGHKIADFDVFPYISFIIVFGALERVKKYCETICEESRQPVRFTPQPPYGSNWGHKIADFVFLPYISFILAFRALACIKRYWETICEESSWLVRFTPTPTYGSNWGHKIAYFVCFPYISFILAFRALECINRYLQTLYEESR